MTLLPGCGQFFPPNSTTGSSTGTGSGTGSSSSSLDSVYVANSNPSLETVSALSLSTTGTLTNLSNSPSALGQLPTLLAINPAGTLLFVATVTGSIYVYVINSDGSLTLGNSSTAVATVSANTITIDPTGQWMLVGLTAAQGSASQVQAYQIDQSNGALTAVNTPLTLDNGTLSQLTFAPNGTELFAALGTGGVDTLSFTPSTGVLGKYSVLLQPLGNSYADQGLAVDPAGKYLFVAETGTNGVRVLSIGTNGALTSVTGSPYPTGLGAKSVLVDKTGTYVYVSNSGANSISAFSLTADGTLTQLAGSPFATGVAPYTLAEDSSKTYLLAACTGGTPDVQVFTITPSTGSTPGALVSASQAYTGSVSPAIASALVTTP